MFAIIGYVVVCASVVGGYAAAGGHLDVLWQPLEFLIIFGGALGAFVAAYPTLLKRCGAAMGTFIKGPSYKPEDYMELIGVLYAVFKLAKSKGDLALEAHVENPDESGLFNHFPSFSSDHHAVEFLCDYLRMLTLGTSNAHEVAEIIDTELGNHHDEDHAVAAALQSIADATPAMGIVAAVLGVIHTMGSITEPPEVLGHLIGAALVGTFSGILIAYGFLAPIAQSVGISFSTDAQYMACIKAGLIAHMQGYAPQVSVEFARKNLSGKYRPSFIEVEEMVGELPGEF
ncbi:MAG: flagellar motor stator protein MotA [Rhodospirillaceae bacterium]|jgi:chemotaxis protein MotA|nr:flagellar motor stator protein MotA [Rhodospirillaceae bacterium]MBT4463919.1 flagellar motor stator protein MotA [Rhodospirillaceae bacterium]MBT5014676.1 flagellar motor stator protein MotA [Rhodospirillaceae bacterium]MBT5308248.1 flagellar motor stator protein MotA [Rhodospirillaceae bacterium]MBT7354777.1 flagellar motor stator protein MotA [Rhodospirillaceae bacterium]